MIDAHVGGGVHLEPLMERLFANPAAAYLHVHNAKRGYYAARIDRSSLTALVCRNERGTV